MWPEWHLFSGKIQALPSSQLSVHHGVPGPSSCGTPASVLADICVPFTSTPAMPSESRPGPQWVVMWWQHSSGGHRRTSEAQSLPITSASRMLTHGRQPGLSSVITFSLMAPMKCWRVASHAGHSCIQSDSPLGSEGCLERLWRCHGCWEWSGPPAISFGCPLGVKLPRLCKSHNSRREGGLG